MGLITGSPTNTGADQTAERLGYGRKEAAHLLGISTPSLDRLVERGLLRPSRALRRPLFSREELERFLRDTTTAA